MAFSSAVTQDATIGNPAPSYKLAWQDTQGGQIPCYISRDFGISSAAIVLLNADFRVNEVGGSNSRVGFGVFRSSSGNGIAVAVDQDPDDTWTVSIGLAGSWAVYGSMVAVAPLTALAADTWFHIEIRCLKNVDGTVTVTAEVQQGSVAYGSVTATLQTAVGSFCGAYGTGPQHLATQIAYIDNFHVQASGFAEQPITQIATNYVYTFVNDLGEESAPCLPSLTVLRPDGLSVTVTTATEVPTGISGDYFIQTKRIYRAATGSTGTVYRFVAEIPLGQADYVDTLADTMLGEVLQSELWALPPSDLRGIIALPNGVMAGFRRNQLCLSAQNHPHAWPVEYRLTTDTDIVGISNIDTTVVIGTKSFLYIASGNDPANYSMNKFEVPYAASSKRSFAFVTGLGVIFSGPDGLMSVRGIGQARNLTEKVFTRRQWQALDPSSIFSVSHNDIYFMFWQSGSVRGCYAVDMRPEGFGIVQMAFHASAAHVDPIADKMYLVLDYDNEPDDDLLPIPPAPPVYVDGRTIYEFEGAVTPMTFQWRSKLFLCPYPSFYPIARVRAEDYENLIVLLYGDGELIDTIVVEGEADFTLTAPDEAYNTFQMELIGTSTVRVFAAANDVMELP